MHTINIVLSIFFFW